jgi:hypothetical protein
MFDTVLERTQPLVDLGAQTGIDLGQFVSVDVLFHSMWEVSHQGICHGIAIIAIADG